MDNQNNYDFIKKLKIKKYYNEPIGEYNIVSTVLFTFIKLKITFLIEKLIGQNIKF